MEERALKDAIETLRAVTPLTHGSKLVVDERNRQVSEERWTAEHDAQWVKGQLVWAAIAYAMLAALAGALIPSNVRLMKSLKPLDLWPWSTEWFKPKGYVRTLTMAAALLTAEIDRITYRDMMNGKPG